MSDRFEHQQVAQNHFLQLEQYCHMHNISLPACRNHTIHCTMLILVLNDTENILLYPKILSLNAYRSLAFPPPPKFIQSTNSWLTGVTH